MSVGRLLGCVILSVVVGCLFALGTTSIGLPTWIAPTAANLTLGGLLLVFWRDGP